MGATKDQFEVVRTGQVGAPPSEVFDRIARFRNWPSWSPWEDIDPDMERTYGGTDGEVGASHAWRGNRKAGEGRMEITALEPGARIEIALSFLKPFKSENTLTFTLAGAGDGTEVTWHMVGPKTLATKIMGIFKSMDKMVGPDFEKGLTRLDAAVRAG